MSLTALAFAAFTTLLACHCFNGTTTLQNTPVNRSSEDLLAQIHGLVGHELVEQLQSEDPRTRMNAVDRAMKFLKDNMITATVESSTPLAQITQNLPTADELEKLMTMTPD